MIDTRGFGVIIFVSRVASFDDDLQFWDEFRVSQIVADTRAGVLIGGRTRGHPGIGSYGRNEMEVGMD